jgi:hypothetical protein
MRACLFRCHLQRETPGGAVQLQQRTSCCCTPGRGGCGTAEQGCIAVGKQAQRAILGFVGCGRHLSVWHRLQQGGAISVSRDCCEGVPLCMGTP